MILYRPVLQCILDNYKKENVLYFEKDPKFQYSPVKTVLFQNGGVYMWKSILFPKMFSIGGTRSQHKELGRTCHSWAKENGGLKSRFPLIFTVSFETIFYTTNPNYQCSIGEDKILKAISHFSPFTLENAVMLHFEGKSDIMLVLNMLNGMLLNFLYIKIMVRSLTSR